MNSFLISRWLFLRIMGFGFVCAFLSLLTQIQGLIGPHGILPAKEYLHFFSENYSNIEAFLKAPTILWLSGTSNLALILLCLLGLIAGIATLLNFCPRLMMFVCWICYLSFVSVAQNFSGFQSDGLMLETALMAVFLAPQGMRPGLGIRSKPSKIVIFLFHWMLFKLMFEAGMVKILSGDATWRNLTAMNDYYENCPFPTWIGYFAQHLPEWFHKSTVVFTFFVEWVTPFLIFLGRRLRVITCICWSLFQLGILLTANYTFLNYNSIALALLLLDDQSLQLLLSRIPLFKKFEINLTQNTEEKTTIASLSMIQPFLKGGALIFFTLYFYITGILFVGTMGFQINKFPQLMLQPLAVSQGFRSANRYGLFASMTHKREHLEFEGSNDGGRNWKPYRFKWQPQELNQRPRFMAPHLPRFDWNLWFATLGEWRSSPYVINAAICLIESRSEVQSLFKENPFPKKPPNMIRFPLYRYQFSSIEDLQKKGNYWNRIRIGYYAPMVVRHPVTGDIDLVKNPNLRDLR